MTESQLSRTSESSRKQRDRTKYIGGYGKKTGDSELLFIDADLGGDFASLERPIRRAWCGMLTDETV